MQYTYVILPHALTRLDLDCDTLATPHRLVHLAKPTHACGQSTITVECSSIQQAHASPEVQELCMDLGPASSMKAAAVRAGGPHRQWKCQGATQVPPPTNEAS
jgi:hypothetical protein